MSSHHIIREKQEPALLVLGLDNFDDELLGQLLEWSPTLIVNADSAERINSLGIKFDILIGSVAGADNIQSDIKHISQDADSAVESALKYLETNNYPAVNVVTDELTLDDYLPYAAIINIVIFYGGRKIYPVTSGFSKWKPAGETIEIVSPVSNLQFTGLKNTTDNYYQITHDGFFSLQFSEPLIFIAESIV